MLLWNLVQIIILLKIMSLPALFEAEYFMNPLDNFPLWVRIWVGTLSVGTPESDTIS